MNLISQSCFDRVEELGDVCVEYPAHLLRPSPTAHGVQRVVCVAPGAEAVAEPEEILFVDGIQYLDRGALDDLSSSVGTPNGRWLPSALSMYALLTGGLGSPLGPGGRTDPAGCPASAARTASTSGPSTPGAAFALERKVGLFEAFRPHRTWCSSVVNRASPVAFCRLSYAIQRGSCTS